MPDFIIYIVFAVLLLAIEIFYFYLADRFDIIDQPNDRSSHTQVTLRGGGIIFPISVFIYSLYSGFEHQNFLLGLLCISLISLMDDVRTTSSKLRFVFHLLAVTFLFIQIGLFTIPFWMLVIAYIVVIGIINAYNFMDGINGITGLYSLVTIITLLYINQAEFFIDNAMLIITSLALCVFLWFNFRHKARCFAGDVGSLSIAFIIIYLLSLLIIPNHEFLYILLLAVYGTDTILTIILRLGNRENIFEAHRSHTYQLLSNEKGMSQLLVSTIYAVAQLLINILVVYFVRLNLPVLYEVIFAMVILVSLTLVYTLIRPHTSYIRQIN
ncbi:MAG: glycosyltransferase family 4 protein [Flavobacterium sp.]|nr:glycosyltransferase family 4 protein [Pedobacter sp.]